MRQLVGLLILIISFQTLKAEKIAQGYVITLKNDTVYGTIDLQKFRTKELTFYKPFNLGMFALSLLFTTKDGNETAYPANSITGFDFEYEKVKYRFRSLNINSEELQSFHADDAPTHVFAELKAEGKFLSYYRFNFNADMFRKYKGRGSYFNYYWNDYVKTPKGLKFLKRTYKRNELSTIMKNDLELEESFIQTIPKKYSLDELAEVIDRYNAFKEQSGNN